MKKTILMSSLLSLRAFALSVECEPGEGPKLKKPFVEKINLSLHWEGGEMSGVTGFKGKMLVIRREKEQLKNIEVDVGTASDFEKISFYGSADYGYQLQSSDDVLRDPTLKRISKLILINEEGFSMSFPMICYKKP